jgi:O-phosphoseryl-tRNA(Sec) kinase
MAGKSGEERCTCSVVLVCGIPAAGKTTLAEKLFKELSCGGTSSHSRGDLDGRQLRVLHVCFDDFIHFQLDVLQEGVMNGEDVICQPETKVWKQQRRNISLCVEQLLTKLTAFQEKTGSLTSELDVTLWHNFEKILCQRSFSDLTDQTKEYLVIVDDNFYYRSMRYEFFQLARKFHCGFGQIVVDCAVEDALCRNRTRASRVPDDIITHMKSRFEMPNPRTHSWEAHSLVIYSSNIETDNAWKCHEFIHGLFFHPTMPLVDERLEREQTTSRMSNLTSIIHQADQVLRKCVSEVMSNAFQA